MLSSIFLESCLDIIDKTTNACFIALTSWIVIILGLEYVAKNQFAFETNRLVDLQFGVNISMVFVYKVDGKFGFSIDVFAVFNFIVFSAYTSISDPSNYIFPVS
jgi:hypothetical protein